MAKKTNPRRASILVVALISTILMYMTYVYSDGDSIHHIISYRIQYRKEANSSIIKTALSFMQSVLSHRNSTGFNDSYTHDSYTHDSYTRDSDTRDSDTRDSNTRVVTTDMNQSSGYQTTIATTLDSHLVTLSLYANLQRQPRHFGDSRKYITVQEDSINRPNINTSLSITSEHKKKVILEWTTFFGTRGYTADTGSACPVTCDVTSDRGRLSSSDAVVFHSRNMAKSDFPKSRLPHQRYVLFGLESPFHFGIAAKDYNGVFNWTATYRQDADIRVTYGCKLKLTEQLTESKIRLFIDNILKKKKKLVMARVSNCGAQNDRLKYIQELRKYIPVDFYGACGDKPCPHTKDCQHDIPQQYKFFLSFENSLCRDYITEKFWDPLLHYNAVPVAMGGSSVSDYYNVAHPHSFLHVDQFKGPRELAEYLTMLDRNDTLYDKYFLWHAHSRVELRINFCQLCVSLNNETLPYQQYTDLDGWFKEDTCP